MNIATINRDISFGLTLDGHAKQDKIILALIARLNQKVFYPSAHDIQSYFPNMLLTSIRRSLSDLKNRDKAIEAGGCGCNAGFNNKRECIKCGKRAYRIYIINSINSPSTLYKAVNQIKLF